MSANIIFVHDDPEFIEEAAAALRLAGHKVVTFREPIEALSALETQHFDILITRVRFAIGQPNGVALARMARMKRPSIKLVFTVVPEYVEYTEELGETVTAPIDIAELVAAVSRVSSE
jgi:DNA-binding NtrC family response regulator